MRQTLPRSSQLCRPWTNYTLTKIWFKSSWQHFKTPVRGQTEEPLFYSYSQVTRKAEHWPERLLHDERLTEFEMLDPLWRSTKPC